MTISQTYPHHHEESGEILGLIARDSTGWQAQTIFGYTIARTTTELDAAATLDAQGLQYTKGVWQYFDKDDNDWYSCVIVKAFENQVIVNRTNALGLEESSNFKRVIIDEPSETNLIKSQ